MKGKMKRVEMKKILLYGGCIFGDGGASKNIKRLIAYIDEHNVNYRCEAYHYNECGAPQSCVGKVKGFSVFNLIKNNNYDLVQMYSTVDWKVQISVALTSLICGNKVILSIRNDRFADIYRNLRLFEKIILRFLFYRASYVIGVNKETNYLFVNSKKLVIIPGFIKPSTDEYRCDLPSAVENFFISHRTVIASNASKLWKYKNIDLYGLDLAIDLLVSLKQKKVSDVGIFFVLSHIDSRHRDYLEELEAKILRLGLKDDFMIWKQSISFPTILERCDLSLRLTSSDGDAVSLRESLFLRTPVIASDVAPRPNGTVIFKSRDLADLTNKTLQVLECLDLEKNKLKDMTHEDNALKTLDLWSLLLNKGVGDIDYANQQGEK